MPRYYFDFDDGNTTHRDHIGIEFPDEHAARNEGTVALASMAAEYLPGPHAQKTISMLIRDEGGEALLELTIAFAVKSAR